jgi:hypothetical protein
MTTSNDAHASHAADPVELDALQTGPRPLISGLTERLIAAGVDPEAVVDDEALFGEIDHLRDRPALEGPRHWWRRRSG